jgi:hypothetical protein
MESRRAQFEKLFTLLGAKDSDLHREFERIVDGMIVLADMRSEIYGELSQNNVGNTTWAFAVYCLLPFWPKEKDEQERTRILRVPLLSNVTRIPASSTIVDRKTQNPLAIASRGFFEYARSIIDLVVPRGIQETLTKQATFEGRRIFRAADLTYRELTNAIPPETVARVIETYRHSQYSS